MSKKLTPWFPPEVKPVRVGVYRVAYGRYAMWNGSKWGYAHSTIEYASAYPFYDCAWPDKQWRGLASKP